MRTAAGFLMVIAIPGSLITYIWTMDIFWIKFLASSFIAMLVLLLLARAYEKYKDGEKTSK